MDSIVTEVWDTDFFNKSHILIWRVSSRIYQSNSILHLPTELFCLESVIFYARQSEATEIINPGKVFAFSTGGETAATALKRFRGKGDSRIGFHVLKRVEWLLWSTAMAPSKGWPIVSASAQTRRPRLHLCCSWRYRCGFFWWSRPWQSARLQTSAPPFERCPWTSVAKRRFSSWLGD